MSNELIKKIDTALEKLPESRPSYFQLKHFILGKQPTIQSQMWQCLKELKTRRDALNSIELETEELKDQLELLDLEKQKLTSQDTKNEILKKEMAIKFRQIDRKKKSINRNLEDLEQKLKFTHQEVNFILQYFESLTKIEPMKDYDDLDVQTQYWNERFAEEINLRILLKQPINIELAKEILCLNDEVPIKIELVKLLENLKITQETGQEVKVRKFLQNVTERLIEKENSDV